MRNLIHYIIAFAKVTIQELGGLLSSQRKRLQLSQAYVAELAGISRRQLLEWEAGRGNPGFEQLQAVLGVVGLLIKIEARQIL